MPNNPKTDAKTREKKTKSGEKELGSRQSAGNEVDRSFRKYEERLRFAVNLIVEGTNGVQVQRQLRETYKLSDRGARDLVVTARQLLNRAVIARAPNRFEDLAVAVWRIYEQALKEKHWVAATAALREYRRVLSAEGGEVDTADAAAALMQLLKTRLDELRPEDIEDLRHALGAKTLGSRKGRPHRRIINELVDELVATELY